jgi:hypothetical protein
MNRFAFWIRWLIVASAGVVVFGLMLAFFPNMPLLGPINDQLETVFALDPPSPGFHPFQHWIYGAWGATIAGWGLLVSFTVWLPLRKKERWAWYGLAASLLFWYLLDTAISLSYGVTDNAILNTVVLIFLGLPLFMIGRDLISNQAT